MITTFYPPYNFGGDGIFVHRLSNELAQRGHQVEVIHCIDSYRLLAGGNPLENCDNHPNVIVHGLKSPLGFLSPLVAHQAGFPFFTSARIKGILKKGFDVINYHNISLFGPKIIEYGEGVKLYTIAEYWMLCPTHNFFRFNRKACRRRRCFLCVLTYGRPPQLWRYSSLLKNSVNQLDAIISASDFAKEKYQQAGFNVPVEYLPNFVPSPQVILPASGQNISEPAARPYFLSVSRLEKLKGIQTIIPVFRRYKKADLLIVGRGSYEPHLRQLARGIPNIKFLGYQFGANLETLYSKAIAVIAPYLNFEVSPLAILEAFSYGTPVIARAIGSMPQLIQEGNAGFVYETEEEFVEAMDKFLLNPQCRNLLGQQAYAAYQQKYNPEVHLEKYLGIVDKLLKRKTGKVSPSRNHGL